MLLLLFGQNVNTLGIEVQVVRPDFVGGDLLLNEPVVRLVRVE